MSLLSVRPSLRPDREPSAAAARDAHALLDAPPGSGPAAFLAVLLGRSGAARAERFVREAEALGFRVVPLRSGDLLASRDPAGRPVGGAAFAAPIRVEHGEARFRLRHNAVFGAGAAGGPAALAAFLYGARAGGAGARGVALARPDADAAHEAFADDELADADLAVVDSSGGWDTITDAAPGRLVAELSVERPLAFEGATPEDEALGWWRRVTARADRLNARHPDGPDRIGIRVRNLRSASDARTRSARLTIDSVLPAWLSPSDWSAQLGPIAPDRSLLARSAQAVAARSEPDAVTIARRAIALTGGEPRSRRAERAGAFNFAASTLGGRVIGYGPGRPDLAGAHDEHVAIDDLERAAEVAARISGRARPSRDDPSA